MSHSLIRIISLIESKTGVQARFNGVKASLVCPIHGDKDRNLSITDGDDRVIMHCHSHGCDTKDIMESIGLGIKDIYFEQIKILDVKKYTQERGVKKILPELEIEFIIGLQWICQNYVGFFGKNDKTEADKDRVRLAFTRIVKVLNYFLKNEELI